MRHILIATAVLAATVAALPLRAESVAKVSYADLDLSSRRDAARLDRRIAGAVEQVCGSYATASHDEEDAITRCRKAALAGYRTQLAAISGGTRIASR